MYVVALTPFYDIKKGVQRKAGEEFVVSKARFDEINAVGMEKLGAPLVNETIHEPLSPEGRKAAKKESASK